jgi:hypothetical protein
MASDMKGRTIGGEGRLAEVDGAYFGGYVKPANHRENRRDRRLLENQSGKRKVAVVARERGGLSILSVFPTEAAGVAFIRSRVAAGTTLQADEATSWNALSARYAMVRIDHQKAYSDNGACTNGAESLFSRLRRAEAGHHHHIAGAYFARYAQESGWREDNRRLTNGDQVKAVIALAAACRPSVDFCGYWQRAKAA